MRPRAVNDRTTPKLLRDTGTPERDYLCPYAPPRIAVILRAESAFCADSEPPGRPGESRTVRARPGTAPWRAHARPAPAGQRMPRPAAPLALPLSRRPPLRNDAGRRAAHSAGTAPGRPFAGPVRGRPWKTDGVPDRATGTDAVRYTSVDTATHRPAVTHPDTGRDKKETARLAENSQLAGRFRRWWQVLGSNQRRLNRRFYRPLLRTPPYCGYLHKHGQIGLAATTLSTICTWPRADGRPGARTAAYRTRRDAPVPKSAGSGAGRSGFCGSALVGDMHLGLSGVARYPACALPSTPYSVQMARFSAGTSIREDPRQSERGQHAGVESRHRTDPVADQGEDQQPDRVQDGGLRVADVDAEGGLAVGPRGD